MTDQHQFLVRSIRKFDGSNFQIWKADLHRALKGIGLLSMIDGTATPPGETATSEAKAEWDKKDSTVMLLMSSNMVDSEAENFLGCDTAAGMWKSMQAIHEERSETGKLTLLQKFYQCSLEGNESVVVYTTRLQNIARRLKDAGEEISDNCVMAKILGGLPEKYGSLVTSWDSVDPTRQTTIHLIERLIKEEKRLDNQNTTLGAFSVASQAGPSRFFQNNKMASGPKKKNKGACHYCGIDGHFARECKWCLLSHVVSPGLVQGLP